MRKISVIPLLFIFFLSSCAYFNTFYNAKKYFNEAEKEYAKTHRITPKERREYEKVIEKCSKILEFYPDSKYVDDALYLMAISYLRIGNRHKARRKFEELFKFFPNSKYVPKAKVEYARLLIESGKPEVAREMLKQSSKTTLEEATLLLARSLALEGKCDKALVELTPLLNRKKLSEDKRIDALLLAAKCSYKTKKYQDAIKYLKDLQKFVLSDSIKVESQVLLGDVYFQMDSLDRAKEILEKIDLPPHDRRKPGIEYRIAKILMKKGERSDAIKRFEQVYKENKYGKYGQLSAYIIANEYEQMDSIKKAIEWFKKASNSRVNLEIADISRQKYIAYTDIEKYKKDTTDVRLKIAELYLFEINKPEKAVKIYKSVIDSAPSQDDLKRALYGLVYIYTEIFHNPDSSNKYFTILKQKFENSIYVKQAEDLIKGD